LDESKIQSAQQAAFEDEIRHIEEELEPRATELARQWLRQEDRTRQQELQAAQAERRKAESIVQNRIRDAQNMLEEEQRKHEEARLRKEEQQRETEKEREQPKQAPETPVPAKPQPVPAQAKPGDDGIWGSMESATVQTVDEHKERINSSIARSKEFLARDDFKNASAEIGKALAIDPVDQEALALQQRIAASQESSKAAVVEQKAEQKREAAPAPQRKQKKKNSSKLIWIAVIVIVIAAAAVVAFFQFRKTLFPQNISVAVLPFRSSGNISDESIVGCSLAEELANRLQHVKSLSVLGFSSSMAMAHSAADPSRAVFDLGYPVILDGTIKYAQGKYLLEVKLSDSMGTTQWTHSYEKTLDQLAQFPGEVTNQVLESLGMSLDADSKTAISGGATSNGSAYMSYLRGLELLHHPDTESAQKALELFQFALDQDKEFVGVLAEAALAIVTKARQSGDLSETTLQHAEKLAQAGMAANPSLVEAHLALGEISLLRRQYQSALREFDEVLALVPNKSEAFVSKALVYLEVGKFDEAVDALNRSCELNPRDPGVLGLHALANQIRNDSHEAVRYHEIALSLVDDSTRYLIGPMSDAILSDPELVLSHGARILSAFEHSVSADPSDYRTRYRLGRFLQISGKSPEATQLLERLSEDIRAEIRIHPQNAYATAYLALTVTRLGRFADGAELAKKALELDKSNPDILYKVSQMYSLQKKPEAMDFLHEAASMRFTLTEVINADYYNFHDKPEFLSAIRLPLK